MQGTAAYRGVLALHIGMHLRNGSSGACQREKEVLGRPHSKHRLSTNPSPTMPSRAKAVTRK